MGTDTGSLARITVRHGGLPAIAVVLIAAFATAACGTAPPAQEERNLNSTGTQPGTVQVRAEGSAEAVPDTAVLGMSVEITGVSVRAARERAARLTQAVIDELERHGVEQQEIQTNRFSIHPDYQYTNDGGRRLNGYRVVHALTVTYRDLDTVGAAIDTVSEAGGNALAFSNIAFTHADPERHREAARRDAVDRLHRTARQLAEASNRELGPLLEISEEVSPDYGPYRSLSAGAAMLRAEAADTPISVGSDVISVTVRGVFALR
jgi:uncharacterized protein YggE